MDPDDERSWGSQIDEQESREEELHEPTEASEGKPERLRMDDLMTRTPNLTTRRTLDLTTQRTPDLATRRTPEMDQHILGDVRTTIGEGRRSSPPMEQDQYHLVNATSSGEVQFRVPRRTGDDTREQFERPRADVLLRRERRALEQPQVRPRGSENLNGAVNSNHHYPSIIGGVRGPPMPDYQSGERIRDREHYAPERQGGSADGVDRDRRTLSPSLERGIRQRNGRGRSMYVERGLWENPGRDHTGPSSVEGTRSVYATTGVGRAHDRQASRKYRKPATYDGTGNWADFLVHFELVAEINQWDDAEKALELATCLRGSAQGVLSDLRPEHRRSFLHLVASLNTRFQPDNQAEMYRAQMKNRLRKRAEPLSELSHDVKRLVRLAYPAAPMEVREHLARDCFIDSLNNSDMEWAVFQGKAASVDEAMRLALEFEAFQAGRKRRVDGKADVRMQYEDRDADDIMMRLAKLEMEAPHQLPFPPIRKSFDKPMKAPMLCYYCAEEGHFIARCPNRPTGMNQPPYRNQSGRGTHPGQHRQGNRDNRSEN
jgi:hypothetical protein